MEQNYKTKERAMQLEQKLFVVIRLFVDIQLLGYLFTLGESVILHSGEEDERIHGQICGGCHKESP